MDLVFIHGPPAAGKLTIDTEAASPEAAALRIVEAFDLRPLATAHSQFGA